MRSWFVPGAEDGPRRTQNWNACNRRHQKVHRSEPPASAGGGQGEIEATVTKRRFSALGSASARHQTAFFGFRILDLRFARDRTVDHPSVAEYPAGETPRLVYGCGGA